MRRIIAVLSVLMIFTLLGCFNSGMPDLEGKTKEDIQIIFDEKGWYVNFQERRYEKTDQSYEFIEYGLIDEADQYVVVIISGLQYTKADLPNLEGKVYDDIVTIMDESPWQYTITKRGFETKENTHQFIEYNDIDTIQGFVNIVVSAFLYDEENFFKPVNIPYDGPYLDDKYFDVDQYPWFIEDSEGIIGGGGAFEVGYRDGSWHHQGPWFNNKAGGCIDGDTTVFTYPDAIFETITSNTPSTRYFNIDTPETYSGGEEEWGQSATQYVCDLLAEAESIVLQTDPGDNLLGRYGRFLAWVWILLPEEEDYQLLNYMIVRQGLGNVAYEYGAGETETTRYEAMVYNDWMHYAEYLAKEEGLGMYSETLIDPYWDYENNQPHEERWP